MNGVPNNNEKDNNDPKLLPKYLISRNVLLQNDVDQITDYEKKDKRVWNRFSNTITHLSIVSIIYQIIPVAKWLPKYPVKKNLPGDIISGITVAVMHIPQGMAYGLLAGVTPSSGLYMAFFPTIVYFLFGTSRHISVGTFSVISLMTAKVVQTYATLDDVALMSETNGTISEYHPVHAIAYTPMQVVTATSFVVGILQLIMCLGRLGVLSTLLSEPLVNGFTTAAAVHVTVSQMKDLLGIQIPRFKGMFRIVYTVIEVFKSIPSANLVTVCVSISIIIFMIFMTEIAKPWAGKRCRFPLPGELIAVAGSTLISFLMQLGPNYKVHLVGDIPTGLPYPEMPPTALLKDVAVDSIAIAIVSYSITMSMALIFSRKNNYEIRPNQELLAMGLSNLAGGLFSCVPNSCSLSRSYIQEQTGGKTQIASIVSAFLILIVLLWIGPVFEYLPRCILAGIILVALKGMFMQAAQFNRYRKEGKIETLTWLVTFFAVILVDIDIGLFLGMTVSIVGLYIKGWKGTSALLGTLPGTGIYMDLNHHTNIVEVEGLKIYKQIGPINFATRGVVKKNLYEAIHVSPRLIRSAVVATSPEKDELIKKHGMRALIMDLSSVTHVDCAGIRTFSEIAKDLKVLGATLFLAAPIDRVVDSLNLSLTMGEGPFNVFPSVHDAVLYSTAQQKGDVV